MAASTIATPEPTEWPPTSTFWNRGRRLPITWCTASAWLEMLTSRLSGLLLRPVPIRSTVMVAMPAAFIACRTERTSGWTGMSQYEAPVYVPPGTRTWTVVAPCGTHNLPYMVCWVSAKRTGVYTS